MRIMIPWWFINFYQQISFFSITHTYVNILLIHFLRNDTFNDELQLKKIDLHSPVKVWSLRFHLIDYKYCSLFQFSDMIIISQNKWKSLKTTLPIIISLVAQKSCLPQIFRGCGEYRFADEETPVSLDWKYLISIK